jgi:hypothetical protein
MSVIKPVCRSAIGVLLVISAVLLVTLASAQAETLTYNIIEYQYTDSNNSNTDVLSGSLTVSSNSNVIGTWNGSSPPPADMTMSLNLVLSNITDPSSYPAASGQSTFFVSDMIGWGWIQRDGITIAQDGVYLHEINTSNPVDFGGYFIAQVTNTSGGVVQCKWAPWDGSVGVADIWGRPYSGGPQIKIWDLNANAILGTGPWQIAQTAPEPYNLTLLGTALLLGLFVRGMKTRMKTVQV